MRFSLPSFVKRTPPESLRGYFAGRDLLADSDLDWGGDKREQDSQFLSAIQELTPEQRETIFLDFEEVQQLCDDAGQRAFRTMVENVAAFDQLEGVEARGLFVLSTNPKGFAHALSIAYAARQYNGRTWSGYYVSQPDPPSDAAEAMDAFEAELREIFTDRDGSGRKMKIERFERPGLNGPIFQYSIFVESTPESGLEFLDDQPRRMTRRPVIEATLCYDPGHGTVDIVAQGGKPVREMIGEVFVEAMLGPDTESLPITKREFDLDRLRQPMTFPFDPADGIRQVSVATLRLRDLTDISGRVTLDAGSGMKDIYAAVDGWVVRRREPAPVYELGC